MTPTSVADAAPALPVPHWSPRELILWSALAVALSASWVDLIRHWIHEPWARPAALFLPLFVLAAARDPGGRAAPRTGALLVAVGLGLSLFAFGGGLSRLGRLGVPLAMIGMARALGRPAIVPSLLALWVIPPPSALAKALSPGLEQGLAWLAAEVAGGSGLPVLLTPRAFTVAGATLELRPTDGGLPLVVYLAGVGWWSAVRTGGDLRRAVYRAASLAPLGLLAQAIGLALAFALLFAGTAAGARTLLDLLPWPVLALALLWAVAPRDASASAR